MIPYYRQEQDADVISFLLSPSLFTRQSRPGPAWTKDSETIQVSFAARKGGFFSDISK